MNRTMLRPASRLQRHDVVLDFPAFHTVEEIHSEHIGIAEAFGNHDFMVGQIKWPEFECLGHTAIGLTRPLAVSIKIG